jgi:hypothetical protein
MIANTTGCARCGGSIGPLIQTQIIAPNETVAKYIEIWFKCIYCEDMGDDANTLIDIVPI